MAVLPPDPTPASGLAATLRTQRALLRRVSLPYLRSHPGRVAALLLAVALGVAAIVASGGLIQSTLAAMERAWQSGDEIADLRIANGFAGLPEAMVERLRPAEGIAAAGGLVSTRGRLPEADGAELLFLAFDLLNEDTLHGQVLGTASLETRDATDFLVRTDAVALDRGFATRHGLALGAEFPVEVRGVRHTFYVAGLVDPTPLSALMGGAIAVMDLPVAQIVFEREGLVDAIDLRIEPSADLAAVRDRLTHAIGDRATVSVAGDAGGELRSLLSSVRLILSVPGAIAIVVGALVVYHAVAVAVSQRKPQLDVVRSLGASRNAMLGLFSIEGLVVGGLGSALGVGLGIGAAQLASGIVRETVSTLYRPLASPALEIAWLHVALGVAIGTAITWFAFVGPARSALRIGAGLAVTSPSRERWQRARRSLVWGSGLASLGIAIGILQESSLRGEALGTLASSGDALVLLGLGLAIPCLVLGLAPVTERALRGSRFVLLRLGFQGLASDPARSATVLTSVMVGGAYVIITVAAVSSLRATVTDWVDRSQTAELIVTAPGSLGFLPSAPQLAPHLGEIVRADARVETVEPLQLLTQPYEERWVTVVGRRPEALGTRVPLDVVAGDLATARRGMVQGDGTLVNELFARQFDKGVGDPVSLRTPTGALVLRIDAVVTDFSAADLGSVFVSPATLQRAWKLADAIAFQAWLAPDADAAAVGESVRATLAPHCDCRVLTGEEYRQQAAELIDSLFYMVYALEVLSALVLLIAVVSFFAVALAERRPTLVSLLTIGATRAQLLGAGLWEAAVIGAVGATLGAAIGTFLAVRMVKTTMRVGGGFTLDFVLPPETVLVTVIAGVVLCVVAALGPLWPLTRPEYVRALREEML